LEAIYVKVESITGCFKILPATGIDPSCSLEGKRPVPTDVTEDTTFCAALKGISGDGLGMDGMYALDRARSDGDGGGLELSDFFADAARRAGEAGGVVDGVVGPEKFPKKDRVIEGGPLTGGSIVAAVSPRFNGSMSFSLLVDDKVGVPGKTKGDVVGTSGGDVRADGEEDVFLCFVRPIDDGDGDMASVVPETADRKNLARSKLSMDTLLETGVFVRSGGSTTDIMACTAGVELFLRIAFRGTMVEGDGNTEEVDGTGEGGEEEATGRT